MSDLAIDRSATDDGGVFRLRTVFILLAVGILGFAMLMLGSAYMPERPNGAASAPGHALSNSAVGFSAIVRLSRALGHETRVIRDESQLGNGALLVVTPPSGATPIGDILAKRESLATLIVLPKWDVTADRAHPGWVYAQGLVYPANPEGVLAPGIKLKVRRVKSGGRPLQSAGWLADDHDMFALTAPRPLQTISGDNLTALITDDQGHIVLGQIGDKPLYVLADPDIIANNGLRVTEQAGEAVRLLMALNDTSDTGIDFDVTAAGLGRPKSPLRLAFDPPFLAATLAIVATLLLVGWQAFSRFGPAVHRGRAIAFGKTALVDNAAGLIRKAGKQARMGGRYVEAIRDRAIVAFGVPGRLRGEAIDTYLDKISGRARFTDLAQAVESADRKADLVQAARALHEWQKEKGK